MRANTHPSRSTLRAREILSSPLAWPPSPSGLLPPLWLRAHLSVLPAVALPPLSSDTPLPCAWLGSRNFGADAAAAFELSIADGPCGEEKAPAPCFALSQKAGKVAIAATSMSELTYGIGYYTRYTCGLTVGRDKWGGSHTNASSWPCTSTLKSVAVPRAVKYTYQDNVCTHSYSYVWYGEEEWTQHIDQMALSGINVRARRHPHHNISLLPSLRSPRLVATTLTNDARPPSPPAPCCCVSDRSSTLSQGRRRSSTRPLSSSASRTPRSASFSTARLTSPGHAVREKRAFFGA